MTIALVQEADAASSSVTLGASATAGNALVVAVACLGPSSATGVTGITIGGSPDNFTLLTPGPSAQDTTSPGDYISVSVWADANCAGGSSAIAVTGTGVVAAWAWEFSGLAGAADLAQVFPVPSYQGSWLSSLPQTSVPAEAWLAITCAANQAATETLTVNSGNGWTTQAAYNGTLSSYFWGAQAAYQTVNDVAAPAWNGTFSQPSFSVTVLVTLPMAPAAAPAPPVAVAPSIASGVTVSNGTLTVAGGVNAGSAVTQTLAGVQMIPVGPKTGNYAAQPGQFVIMDGSHNTGPIVTFPPAPPNGSMVGVKLAIAGPTAVRVQAAGTDVFDAQPPGTAQIVLNTTGQTFTAQYHAGTWYTQSTGSQLPPALPANIPLPSDLGYVTWSYDPAYLSGTFGGAALPGGKLFLVLCPVRATAKTAGVAMWITSGGSGLTAGQNFTGVYDINGNLLAATPDLTSSWGSTGYLSVGFNSAAAISPPCAWVAFLSNGTTKPSLAVTGNQTAGWANGPATFARFGTVAGPFTSLPSSFGGIGSVTEAAPEYWAALS